MARREAGRGWYKRGRQPADCYQYCCSVLVDMWRSLVILAAVAGLAASSAIQRTPREKKTGFGKPVIQYEYLFFFILINRIINSMSTHETNDIENLTLKYITK